MKRTVRRWARTCLGNGGRKHITTEIFWTRKEAKIDAINGQAVVKCVVSYDDGELPKWTP